MAGRASAARAARRHLIATGVGFTAALAVAKAFIVPQSAESEGAEGDQKRELKLVQVVFRHGARTPLGQKYWPELGPKWDVCGKAYDAVPVNVLAIDGRPRPINQDDEKQVRQRYEGGCSKGELTLVGQQQALAFGRWLRWRYHLVHGVLPGAHAEGVVNARTTNYSRTIATLQGVLSGLFPGTAHPITVHTTEEIDEVLYTNVKSCGRLHQLMQDLHRQQREASELGADPAVEAVQQRVRAALGLPADHRVSFVELHDAMTSMQTHGKEVPPGMRDEQLLRDIDRLATARFMHVIAPHPDTGKTHEVLRLGMGVLMEMMVRRMEAAAAGEAGDTRMFLYSGHDSSLMPLLAALGKHVEDWPPYLSNLTLELWQQPSGQHFVKVLYNKKELPLEDLCGAPACELQLFKEKVIGPYLLTKDQHQKECMLHFLHDKPAGEHTETEEVQVGSSFQEEADPKAPSGGTAVAAVGKAAGKGSEQANPLQSIAEEV